VPCVAVAWGDFWGWLTASVLVLVGL